MKFEKVNKIVKYASNTVDDYYRLQIIENWRKDRLLDDSLLGKYLMKMHEFMPYLDEVMSPGDLAYILCVEPETITIDEIKGKYLYG